MSKLNQPRIVDMTLAEVIGMNEAMIFNQLDYWFEKVKGRNIRGERWVYITYDQWQEQFPIWSIDTIQRAVKHLREIGLITTEKENALIRGSRNSHLHYQIDREHKILKDLGIYTEPQIAAPRTAKPELGNRKMRSPANTYNTEKNNQENTHARYASHELKNLWTRARKFLSQKSQLFQRAVDSYISEEMRGRNGIRNPKMYKKTIEVEIWKKYTGQPHNTSFEFNEMEEEMKQQAINDRFDKDVVVLF